MVLCKRFHATVLAAAVSVFLSASAQMSTTHHVAHSSVHHTMLAATPPMGWNSWNHFAGKVNDADVRAAADALVSSGLRDKGYIYVNIDDTWEGQRDSH